MIGLSMFGLSTCPPLHAQQNSVLTQNEQGQFLVQRLRLRYADPSLDCGSDNKPSLQCSGILLRGTSLNTGTTYNAWDPSPTAIRVGGISFSYLRSDFKMYRLAYDYVKGFIFYPALSTPPDKTIIETLCFFPIDGASDNRANRGCGIYNDQSPISVPCNEQNIHTAEQWFKHYNDYPKGKYRCSFDISNTSPTPSAPAFEEGLKAGQLVFKEHYNKVAPSDVKMVTWVNTPAQQLPIEAFFYTDNTGITSIQKDQKIFFDQTGTVLPIIKITLPATLGQDATFEYLESDQAIELPSEGKPEPAVLKTYNIEGDHLRMSDIYNDSFVTVQLPLYDDINGGKDTIRVYWRGRVSYSSSIIPAANPPALTEVSIPRAEVIDNIGRSVNVSYSVKANGVGESHNSASLILYIDPQAVDPLPPPTYSASVVSATYAGEAGDTIKLRWAGTTTHDTATQTVIPGKPNTFSIPSAWITENSGKKVFINYSIKRSSTGSNLMFSHILRATMP